MMNGINSFIMSFCTVCILIGGLYIICPSGTFSKSVKYVFCLVLICCVAATVKGIKSTDFDFAESSEAKSVEISQTAAASAAEQVFSVALKNENIEFSQITVCTDKTDDGSIIITEVIVYSSDDPNRIKKVIESGNNYEVSVINE